MNNSEHIVNLDLPPKERWHFLSEFSDDINSLLQYYLDDFEEAQDIFTSIGEYKKDIISEEYLLEIDYIASISKFTPDQVLIANLYYDILKFYFGCTAFAVHHEGEVLHARNLDWHTENNILSKHSKIFNFQKNGKTIYKTVGWTGFVGALSGTRPGSFSITLNAVLSNDQPEIDLPISFLIRHVLNTCQSFTEAKDVLEKTPIASDCLILLSGTKADEMVVIERTPKRYATRTGTDAPLVVTNDYKKLQNSEIEGGVLQSTSCGRFNRATHLLTEKTPHNALECLDILKDDKVMMQITVQQMVFNNTTGDITLIKTNTE